MAIPDTSGGGARHVRCPKCHSVLQEPSGVPVYQCGGCGASLRAKSRSGDAQEAAVSAAPSSDSVLPSPRLSQSRRSGSGDVASTGVHASTPGAPTTARHQGAGGTGRSGDAQDAAVNAAQSSERALAPSPRLSQGRRLGSGDVASTSAPASTPGAPTSARHRGAGTTRRSETGGLTPSREHRVPEQASPSVEKNGRDHRSADRGEADGSSGRRRARGAVSAPSATAKFTTGSRDAAAEMQNSERRREAEPEPADATAKRGSDEAARHRSRDLGEAAPVSARAADSRSAPAAVSWKRRDDAAAATAASEEKAPSPPPRHAVQPQKMSPLHEKILKTVDELKDDLSELFSKSPELKPRTPPRTPARPPRLPEQQGLASRGAIPDTRAPHAAAAAALHRRGNAGYAADKHGQAAPRGLPSRRYRRCRADTFGGHDARLAGPCRRHSCCDHGKPECGSCRGHCCGSSRVQKPARPAAVEAKRRAPPPKHHCRPVLKGAPFIICSSCFTLVQVPAGFAVASARVRDLRCGACSAVLSYSYRDPDRKKPAEQHGTYPARHVGARPDLFSFIEDFAGGVSSYSTTEDERPLHVSRNSSFDTQFAAEEAAARPQSNSLHRLMGYGSASELLRRSPSLYEHGSFDKRSTPPSNASRRYDDRKGKAICLDTDDDVAGDDDSDDGGAPRRSNVRGAGWGHGRGVPAPGAIRIRS